MMDPMTLAFAEEIDKIAFSPGARNLWRKARHRVMAEAAKRKGGLKGALMSYGFTMGAAPLLGYTIGRLLAPKGEKASRKEVKKPESVIGHSLMPGYSEYVYGRKSVARSLLKKLETERKAKKEK
jgi:hypothetical protein